MANTRPDQSFISKVIKKYFSTSIPQGYRFFGRDNGDQPVELNKFMQGWADTLSGTWYKLKAAKQGTTLTYGWAEYLDLWALDAGTYRLEGESDERLRQRLILYILGKKNTKPGIDRYVKFTLDSENYSIYEPWRELGYLQTQEFKKIIPIKHGILGSSIIQDQEFYRRAVFSVDTNYLNEELIKTLYSTLELVKPVGVNAFIRAGNNELVTREDIPLIVEADTPGELCSTVFEDVVFNEGVFYKQNCSPIKPSPIQIKLVTHDGRFIITSQREYILVNLEQ